MFKTPALENLFGVCCTGGGQYGPRYDPDLGFLAACDLPVFFPVGTTSDRYPDLQGRPDHHVLDRRHVVGSNGLPEIAVATRLAYCTGVPGPGSCTLVASANLVCAALFRRLYGSCNFRVGPSVTAVVPVKTTRDDAGKPNPQGSYPRFSSYSKTSGHSSTLAKTA